jgi:hypothetical protein
MQSVQLIWIIGGLGVVAVLLFLIYLFWIPRDNPQPFRSRDAKQRAARSADAPRIKSKKELMDFLQQEIGNEDLALLLGDVVERIGREGFVDVKPGGTGNPYAVEYDHRLEAEQAADKRTCKEVAAELEATRAALKQATTDDERDRLARERARLAGGVAILWINVRSSVEYERLRGRVKHTLRKLEGLTEKK